MKKENVNDRKKISVTDLFNKKINKELVAWITAYDLPFSAAAEDAGIDMILVGDSGGWSNSAIKLRIQ